MAEKYTAESFGRMTVRQLKEEKTFLSKMLVIWRHLADPLPETIRGYYELGSMRQTKTLLFRYKQLRLKIRGTENALVLLDEELRKRGAL